MTSTNVYDRGSRSHATGTVSGSTHTVAAGDSFYSIGLRFGLPWQEVTRANNLADIAFVQPDKRLLIPGLNPQPPVTPPVRPARPDHCPLPQVSLVPPASCRPLFAEWAQPIKHEKHKTQRETPSAPCTSHMINGS